MVKFLSSWAKGIGLSVVIISILEMLLPNNKTKKYVKMVMGIYIIYMIVEPFISNINIFDINSINLEEYAVSQTSTTVDQTSMDKRIQELYIEEIEKDITKKIEQKGYVVSKCKVYAKISDKEEETKINKIKINIKKAEESETTSKKENEDSLENKIITNIEKIKPINTSIKEKDENKKSTEKEIKNTDIQNIKKFLIDEYGVNEKCLEIN